MIFTYLHWRALCVCRVLVQRKRHLHSQCCSIHNIVLLLLLLLQRQWSSKWHYIIVCHLVCVSLFSPHPATHDCWRQNLRCPSLLDYILSCVKLIPKAQCNFCISISMLFILCMSCFNMYQCKFSQKLSLIKFNPCRIFA